MIRGTPQIEKDKAVYVVETGSKVGIPSIRSCKVKIGVYPDTYDEDAEVKTVYRPGDICR